MKPNHSGNDGGGSRSTEDDDRRPGLGALEPQLEDLLSVLRDEQRRLLLEYLDGRQELPVSLEECTRYLSEREPVRDPSLTDEDRIRIALVHVHLPKLDEHEIVAWNGEAERIDRGRHFDAIRPLLEEMRDRDAVERRNDRLDRFARVIAHDLRNPLIVADRHLALLAEDRDGDHVDAIRRAHQRIETLVDDLLATSRSDDDVLEMQAVSLEELATHAWQNIRVGDATLVVDTERVVQCDPVQLGQLLENLMSNAVTHGGDAVTVTIGELPDDEGFFLEDDGVGIPEELRTEVFKTGVTTVDDGTGLGLSIVEHIVRIHGWDIELLEGEHGGARFEITGVDSE